MIAADPLQATAPTRARPPIWRGMIRPSRGLVGLVIVLVLTVLALLAPSLPLPSPTGSELTARLQPPDLAAGHPFGTDQLGRDLLSRVIWGARISLAVGFTTVFLAGGIGVLLGLSLIHI